MEHSKELLSIRLSELVASPYNVRRHPTGQIEELAALIASQGLLHPLIVTEQSAGRGKARKLRFAVAAGERRRRALLLLQQRGELDRTHEVLCELVPPEAAREISVAENSGRQALHPADEFEAFKALIENGRSIEDVAARFGVSVLTVQRRLKLSAASPKLVALYREEGINLDQLMALSLSDDHGVQERAWFDALPWDRTPTALRRKLTAGEVEAAGSALVRLVGLEAYESAGGIVRRDLFDDNHGGFLSDPALLERLASEKLEAIGAEVRSEGWAWVEARVDFNSHALRQFTPCDHTRREPSPGERKQLSELARRSKELERASEALVDADGWTAAEAEPIDLEEQDIAVHCKAIHDGLKVWSTHALRHAGAVVTVNREGDAEVIRGLVREGDRKAFKSAVVRAEQPSSARAEEESTRSASSADESERRPPTCSESLAKRLAAHRTVALQLMLSRNAAVTLASLVHVFVQRVFRDEFQRNRVALQVTPQLSAPILQAAADDLKGSTAWEALESAKQAWRTRLPEQSSTWFPWLLALPQADLLDLLTLCVSLTLNALPNGGAGGDADQLADAVGLDMADWWEPTAQSYLNHVPKAMIVQALKEAGPGLADDGVAAMNKEALVVAAAARLGGKRWLPESMRRQAR